MRVRALREALAGSGWIESTRAFAGTLRGSVTRRGAAGLLLVGIERYEPWHLAAHLDDEASLTGIPELTPTLVRHRVPPDAPAHLSNDLGRLAAARRGATVLVVAPDAAGAPLLERVQDARRGGATVLALDAGDRELGGLAHEQLTVEDAPTEEPFELVQHLVSAAAGEGPRRGGRWSRVFEQLVAPPAARW